jgi:hypothetical protein
MLKATIDNQIQLVQQPQHAQVSGYLAAHWGGVNGFARPGHYPGAKAPARVRDEVVLGIAEHDNGWWEWEAIPRISANDGLPVGLGEQGAGDERKELAAWRAGGYDRWRVGIGRLADPHPYAALLVSLHAYWLYAVEFPDLVAAATDVPRHFIFSGREGAPVLVGDAAVTRAFLEEQAALQRDLTARLAEDGDMVPALAMDQVGPHVRLLQLMDTLSLYLSLGDTADHVLAAVPRSSAEDRVDIAWRQTDGRTFSLDPYPFDLDPLPVHLPVRLVEAGEAARQARAGNPYAALHGAPVETVKFWFRSGR